MTIGTPLWDEFVAVKLNIRQLVNAIILAFIKEHDDKLKNNDSG